MARVPLSTLDATFLLLSCNIGGFLLACPLVLYQLGLLLSLCFLAIALMLTLFSNSLMARLIIDTGAYSFLDIVRLSIGRKSEIIAGILLPLALAFLSIAQVYISASIVQGVTVEVLPQQGHYFFKSKSFSILFVGAILLLFINQSNALSSLTQESGYILLLLLFFFIMVLIIYASENYTKLRKFNPDASFKVPFLPRAPSTRVLLGKSTLFLISLSSAHLSTPILNAMNEFSYRSLKSVLDLSSILVAFLTLGFSLIGVTIFGEVITHSDTLLKVIYIQARSIVAVAAQLMYLAVILCHLPIVLFSTRQSFLQLVTLCNSKTNQSLQEEQRLLFRHAHFQSDKDQLAAMHERVPTWLFYLISLLTYLIVLLVPMLLHNIQMFLELSLGPASVLASQVVPAICYLSLKRCNRYSPNRQHYYVGIYLGLSLASLAYTIVTPILELQ